MPGKSPTMADEEQREGLRALAHSRERGEADRVRAILLTLAGWTSPRIAQAFEAAPSAQSFHVTLATVKIVWVCPGPLKA